MPCASKHPFPRSAAKLASLVGFVLSVVAVPTTGTANTEAGTIDRQLQQVCRKVANLPAYRAAQLGIELAVAQQDQVSAKKWLRGRVRAGLGPSPDIRCENADCTITSPTEPTLNIAGVMGLAQFDAIQPLYTFGKLSAADHAAESGVERARAQAEHTKSQLLMLVARAYYGHHLAREMTWMLADGQETVAKALTRVNEAIDSGSNDLTLTDRYRLQTLEGEIAVRRAQAEEKLRVSAAALTKASGATFAMGDSELRPLPTPQNHQAVLPAAPELLAARAGASALAWLAEVEEARFWPDISLFASAQISSAQGVDNPPSAFANDPFNRQSAAVGVGVEWNLDPVGQYSRQKSARVRSEQAAKLSAALEDKISLEQQEANIHREATHKRLQAATAAEKSARAWLAATLQNEALGTAEPKDLVDAYIAFFTAKGRLLEAIFDWNLAVLDLLRHRGGLEAALTNS